MHESQKSLEKAPEEMKTSEYQPSRKSEEQIESDKKLSEETDKKKKNNKPLRKKAKRVKSSKGAQKDDESIQKCVEKQTTKDSLMGKAEEKTMQNIAEKASSRHPGIEKSPKKPQQGEETLEESPRNSNMKHRAKKLEERKNEKPKKKVVPIRRKEYDTYQRLQYRKGTSLRWKFLVF